MNSLSNQLNHARALIQAKRYDEAVSVLVRIAPTSNGMWWAQMELARAQRRGRLGRDQALPYLLLFSPHYSTNHYQTLLHSSLLSEGVDVKEVNDVT